MISRHQHAPNYNSAPLQPAAAANAEEGSSQAQNGLNKDQLNAMFPVGHHVAGLCNFVIHDKDKTPISEIFPEAAILITNAGQFKHKFTIERLNDDDVRVSYFNRLAPAQPIFQHWTKYEVDHSPAFRHVRYLANNTIPGLDTTQVNLDVRFHSKDDCDNFVKMHEFGKVLGGYTGVRFGRR